MSVQKSGNPGVIMIDRLFSSGYKVLHTELERNFYDGFAVYLKAMSLLHSHSVGVNESNGSFILTRKQKLHRFLMGSYRIRFKVHFY